MRHDDTRTTGEVWTREDVAEHLRCSTRQLDRMRASGAIPPPIRIGGLVRWRADDIRQWLSAGCPTQIEEGMNNE